MRDVGYHRRGRATVRNSCARTTQRMRVPAKLTGATRRAHRPCVHGWLSMRTRHPTQRERRRPDVAQRLWVLSVIIRIVRIMIRRERDAQLRTRCHRSGACTRHSRCRLVSSRHRQPRPSSPENVPAHQTPRIRPASPLLLSSNRPKFPTLDWSRVRAASVEDLDAHESRIRSPRWPGCRSCLARRPSE